MKAQLISDIHSEMYYGQAMDVLTKIEFIPDLDFLLLPGDIIVPFYQSKEECRDIFNFFSSKARHCIYLKGNHENYNSLKNEEVDAFIQEIMPSNFNWLRNTEVTIEGVHFYGGTLWFRPDPVNLYFKHMMSDFSTIKDINNWVYLSNEEFREKGRERIKENTIVLSHHLPSPICTPKQFQGSPLNRFFVSDETDLILEKKPRYWIYGHTHTPFSGKLGSTKLVCNPYAYPSERKWMPKYHPVVIDL